MSDGTVNTKIVVKQGVNPAHFEAGFSLSNDIDTVVNWSLLTQDITLPVGKVYLFQRNIYKPEEFVMMSLIVDCNGISTDCAVTFIKIKQVNASGCVVRFTKITRIDKQNCTVSFQKITKIGTGTVDPPIVNPPIGGTSPGTGWTVKPLQHKFIKIIPSNYPERFEMRAVWDEATGLVGYRTDVMPSNYGQNNRTWLFFAKGRFYSIEQINRMWYLPRRPQNFELALIDTSQPEDKWMENAIFYMAMARYNYI